MANVSKSHLCVLVLFWWSLVCWMPVDSLSQLAPMCFPSLESPQPFTFDTKKSRSFCFLLWICCNISRSVDSDISWFCTNIGTWLQMGATLTIIFLEFLCWNDVSLTFGCTEALWITHGHLENHQLAPFLLWLIFITITMMQLKNKPKRCYELHRNTPGREQQTRATNL